MAEEKVRYIPLYNQWRDFTLKDFVQKVHIFVAKPDGSEESVDDVVSDLFDYNKELIFSQMTDEDKRDFAFYKGSGSYPTSEDKDDKECFEEKVDGNYPTSSDDIDKDMILPYPCKLRIDSRCITSELMISQTNFQEMEDDFYAFEDERIAEVLDEPDVSGDMFSKSQPKCTVILWCRSDVVDKGDYQYDDWSATGSAGQWRNLSDYVTSISSNVTQQGGSFNIRIPYLLRYDYNRTNDVINLDTKEVVGQHTVEMQDLDTGASKGRFLRIDNSTVSDKASLLHKIASTNDLIFISFNDLIGNQSEYTLTDIIPQIVSEGNFDMIGLIDNVSCSKTYEGAQGFIDISGRDLSKLIIDDGSFFFNPSTTVSPSTVFFNEQGYAKQGDIREVDSMNGTYQAINRLRRSKGELDIFCNQPNQTISYVIKGVLSQLANIEVVPSDTFELWDNRTTWVEMHPDDEIVEEEVTKINESSNNETEMAGDDVDAASPTEEEIAAAETGS